MRTRATLMTMFLCAWLAPRPALANFHLMKLVEVFPGTAAAPQAQYVVIQMYSGGQTVVGGHSIIVFDAAGTAIPGGTFTFSGSVANGASQTKILIATPSAVTFFGVSADLSMTTAVIPAAGGKVCFDSLDCVAWGNYSGSPTGVGTPFNATGGGLRPGRAMIRRLNIAGGATTLEGTDDTGDSANDFVSGAPAPRNNASQNGTVPSATCGDGTVGGLEQCDDDNTVGGDGCRQDCLGNEVCGDQLIDLDAGETCDDGNVTDGDACPASCGVVAAAEASPAGTLQVTPGAGSALDVSFTPACDATDHAAYGGVGPSAGVLNWTFTACGLGIGGAASFDPGNPASRQLFYFVVVGYNASTEGSYGRSSAGVERPEAVGVGACDESQNLTGTCL